MKPVIDVIYAADVGKPGNLGWARRAGDKLSVGHGALSLAEAMASDASNRSSLAVGFEYPSSSRSLPADEADVLAGCLAAYGIIPSG